MKFRKQESNNKSSVFAKLESGQSLTGVIAGEIFEFEHVWNEGDQPKSRFKFNIIVNQDGALLAKIYECGVSVAAQLNELEEAGWDLDKTFVRISRKGSGLDTEYSVTALPTPVPADVLAKIPNIKLNELKVRAPNSIKGTEGSFQNFESN